MLNLAKRDENYPNIWSPLSIFENFNNMFKFNSNLYFSEEGDYSVVECDVPGIEKDQIKVTLDEEREYVVVEAVNEKEKNKKQYKYSFSINPSDLDLSTEPQLNLNNGVLTIKFKKSEKKRDEDEKIKVLKIE